MSNETRWLNLVLMKMPRLWRGFSIAVILRGEASKDPVTFSLATVIPDACPRLTGMIGNLLLASLNLLYNRAGGE